MHKFDTIVPQYLLALLLMLYFYLEFTKAAVFPTKDDDKCLFGLHSKEKGN